MEIQLYKGEEITIRFDPKCCMHTADLPCRYLPLRPFEQEAIRRR